MSRGIFVTGAGTDMGKTYITGLILKKLREAGLSAAYFKAAVSGNERGADGALIPGDPLHVKTVSGIDQPLEEMCPYVYENAVSPHLAARIEGSPVEPDVIKSRFADLCSRYDFITMEGSGGIICPIRWDGQKILLEDIIRALGLDCIIVADAGLGTINSVVLTCEYMKSRGIAVKGIIFNNWQGGAMEEDNRSMCQEITGVPVIACVERGADDLDISADELTKLYGGV